MDEIGAKIREAKTHRTSSSRYQRFEMALVVLSILSSTFLFALDNTFVANSQPVIITSFSLAGKANLVQHSILDRCSIDELGLGQDLSLVGIVAPWSIAPVSMR
jgi:hypothetical protein